MTMMMAMMIDDDNDEAMNPPPAVELTQRWAIGEAMITTTMR